jgi:hypothetical protein
MAVSRVASSNQHSIRPIDEGLKHIDGIDGSRTHQVDDPNVGRILLPGCSCEIRSGVSAPVAKKRDDPRLKFTHLTPPYLAKSEIRISKSETKSEFQMFKSKEKGLISNFVFRASNFSL